MQCSICNKELLPDEDYIVDAEGNIICSNCNKINIENPSEQNIEATNADNEITTDELSSKKRDSLDKRISVWKEKLIDLSKRNRLLNFKQTPSSTLRIIDEKPTEVLRQLYFKSQQMEFLHININDEDTPDEEKLSREALNEGIEFKSQEFESYQIENLEYKHVDNFLQTNLSEKDLKRTLRKIGTTAKNTIDDLGYNVLFLTLGSVIWYEREDSNEKFESPLILLPIKLVKSDNDSIAVEYNDDEIILNPALVLKFKKEFALSIDDINTIDMQETDILKIFELVQNRIKNKKRWKLLENCYIGLFSFAKFVMYKDLDKNKEKVKSSSLVKCICRTKDTDNQKIDIDNACPTDKLDTNVLPKDTYQILDADSSQQQAIAFVKENNNLVIEGPPGTGKSQTIANIIAELLSQGKKVLFVSQKIAALEVVQNRLESNGLAPYCLELHSNKINRKQVIENLLNSTCPQLQRYNTSARSLDLLQERKIELNEYVKAVHEPIGTFNKSPYYAIGKVCQYSDIPDYEYIFENYEDWNEAIFENKKNIFITLKSVVKTLGNPKLFSWHGSNIKNLDGDYRLKLEIKNQLKELIENIKTFGEKINKLSTMIFVNNVNNLSKVPELIKIAKIIKDVPIRTIKNVKFDNQELSKDINKICECIKQFNIYNNRIKEHYNLGILNEDLENLIMLFEHYSKSFFNKISLEYFNNKKIIKSFCIKKYNPSSIQIVADLKNIKELKHWLDEINNSSDIAENIYNELWNKENSNEEIINNSSKSIIEFQKLIKNNNFTSDIVDYYKNNELNYTLLNELIVCIEEMQLSIKTQLDKLFSDIKFDSNETFQMPTDNIGLDILKNKFTSMLDDIDNLSMWSQYLTTIDSIKEEKLQEFYQRFLNSGIDFDKIDIAFETQFLRVWLNDFVYQKCNILRTFDSAQHNRLISEFKHLDKDLINSSKIRLQEKLYSNMINGKNSYSKEFANLEREGKLQRHRKSLRQIIQMIPNLLLSIKPCLMMSPLTVAQLIEPDMFQFDYVIFDEASQLTTEDCIGSMIRGRKLIVAGDSNQLPPTSFFRTVTEPSEEIFDEDEEVTEDDLDSILDECSTAGFPKCMLKWHYRSRDEHLIAFSNKHLYKELYTFPSAVETSDTMGIKWHYHESDSSTEANARLEEAKIVANLCLEHARKFPNRSLGVATFNIKQKGLIEDEIAKLLESNRDCVDFFSDSKAEPFFCKNLESIQGDERDVIIISMGYFKNKNGILSMNFGPINQDGGERRLNVLVTRARYKIELVSAIRYVDFNLDKTKSKGVELLKKYLEFAERGEVALISDTQSEIDDHFDSPFEEAVCQGLREAGLSIKTQVGCSGYKIDMAIRDEKNPGEFLLGIECDGRSYHSSKTARDRDRLRQSVLENLGWKFYRIWSTDWFKNPKRELEKLIKHIESLKIKNELMEKENANV